MIFKPRPLSRTMLDDASLVRDKQHCRRIGPCGVGRRALYLNSYFIDRHYYVPFSAITRAFKFIEEGTGGVRGVLAGRACLLVEYDNGLQQVCCFKYEDQIDELLRVLHKMHPEIPCVSEEEEAELEVEYERRRAEERRRPPLSIRAEREIEELENAIAYLERKPELYKRLSRAAKRRRNYQSRSAGYRWAAAAIRRRGVARVPRFLRGYLLLCLLAAAFLWRMAPAADGTQQQPLRGCSYVRAEREIYAHPIVCAACAIAEGALNVMEAAGGRKNADGRPQHVQCGVPRAQSPAAKRSAQTAAQLPEQERRIPLGGCSDLLGRRR